MLQMLCQSAFVHEGSMDDTWLIKASMHWRAQGTLKVTVLVHVVFTLLSRPTFTCPALCPYGSEPFSFWSCWHHVLVLTFHRGSFSVTRLEGGDNLEHHYFFGIVTARQSCCGGRPRLQPT